MIGGILRRIPVSGLPGRMLLANKLILLERSLTFVLTGCYHAYRTGWRTCDTRADGKVHS
jgi:hypothetical protein